MKAFTFLFTMLVAITVPGFAVEPQPAPEVEVGRNVRIRTFAFGGVGYAGVTSEGEKYFFTVLTSAGAKGFAELFERGDAQAKAYALTGLRWLSDTRYERLRDAFVAAGGNVQMAQGCLFGEFEASEIAARIDRRTWDDHIAAVMKRRANPESSVSAQPDTGHLLNKPDSKGAPR